MEADAWPYVDEVVVDPRVGTMTLTRIGDHDDAGLTGDLDVTDDVTIDGKGVVVSGQAERGLQVRDATADVVELAIVDGRGGLRQDGGTVSLTDVAITGHTLWDSGVGIAVDRGDLTVVDSTSATTTAWVEVEACSSKGMAQHASRRARSWATVPVTVAGSTPPNGPRSSWTGRPWPATRPRPPPAGSSWWTGPRRTSRRRPCTATSPRRAAAPTSRTPSSR